MKASIKLSFFSMVLLFASSTAFAKSNWDCTPFAEVVKEGSTLFTLASCITAKGYSGKVKWRLTNHSNMTIYGVSIADKVYTLADKKVVKRSGESLSSKIAPGETKSTMSDAVNSSENYGNWSDKNDNPVVRITLEQPMIKFATEKKGKKYGWDRAGEVVTK